MCASQHHSTAPSKVALEVLLRANSVPTHCTRHSLACSPQGRGELEPSQPMVYQRITRGADKDSTQVFALPPLTEPARLIKGQETGGNYVTNQGSQHLTPNPIFFSFPPCLRTHFPFKTLPILTHFRKARSPTPTQPHNSLREDSSSKIISSPQFPTSNFKAKLSYNQM